MINNFASSYNLLPMGIGVGMFALGTIIFIILMIVLVVLKGYALWIAARKDDKGWFIAILLLNVFGILELVYLYFIADVWNKKGDTKVEPVKEDNKGSNPTDSSAS